MILMFASEENNAVNALNQWAENHASIRKIERCACLEDIESRLRRPHPDIRIFLFFVKNAIEIIEMTKMQSILLDLNIIIALPYRDNDMVSWAHKFGPRFISYATDDQEILTSALTKILERI